MFARTHIHPSGELTPLVHAVCNLGLEATNFLGIEVKTLFSPSSLSPSLPLLEESRGYKRREDLVSPSFSVYQLTVEGGKDTGEHPLPKRGLVVFWEGEKEKWEGSGVFGRVGKGGRGEVLFWGEGERGGVKNKGCSAVVLYLVVFL